MSDVLEFKRLANRPANFIVICVSFYGIFWSCAQMIAHTGVKLFNVIEFTPQLAYTWHFFLLILCITIFLFTTITFFASFFIKRGAFLRITDREITIDTGSLLFKKEVVIPYSKIDATRFYTMYHVKYFGIAYEGKLVSMSVMNFKSKKEFERACNTIAMKLEIKQILKGFMRHDQ